MIDHIRNFKGKLSKGLRKFYAKICESKCTFHLSDLILCVNKKLNALHGYKDFGLPSLYMALHPQFIQALLLPHSHLLFLQIIVFLACKYKLPFFPSGHVWM